MTVRIEIRPLLKEDDRAQFSCGQEDLDRFFRHYAGQNQFKLHVSITYVAVRNERIVGFATVSAGGLERERLPEASLRRRFPRYPLPILRLARLGVHTEAQGLGIGKALLRHVIGLGLSQREALGCVGVVTDAKPEAVDFYKGLGFVPLVAADA